MSGAAFSRQVDVFVARHLSPQAQSAALAETARRGVAELIAAGRASPQYRRIVDGVEGAPETAVRPDGTIVYRFEYLAEVIVFALGFLQQRSPARSGRYRRGFYLGLDGKFVPADRFNPATMGRVNEVMIGNVEPYSRKVDVQLVGTTRLRFRTPPDLFADAAAAVRRRFGNFVTVRRLNTARFPGQYVLKGTRRAGKPVDSPALAISAR